MTGNFDILIVGAGPAGLAAAVAAASSGKRVGLVDENVHPGGQIWHSHVSSNRHTSSLHPAAAKQLARLHGYAVTRLQGWRVISRPVPNILRAEQKGELLELNYEKLIIATGARERFLPFPGWTLPNVFGIGGLQSLIKTGLTLNGKHVVLAGSGPLLLAAAAYARHHGASVSGIFEQAPADHLIRFGFSLVAHPSKILQGMTYKMQTMGAPFRMGCWPVEAVGNQRVESVKITNGRQTWEIPCDYLACSFNFVPNSELASLLGCRIVSKPQPGCVFVDEWQQTSVPGVYCAGEPTGIGGVELSQLEGEIAGFAASGKQGHAERLFSARSKMQRFAEQLDRCFRLRPELKYVTKSDTIICRCEDVPLRDLKEHTSWRSAKLHTRCGMGPCQGRICGSATEFLLGWRSTAVRPPIFPAQLSSLASVQSQNEAQASIHQEAL